MAGRIGKLHLKNIEQQVHEYNVTLTKIIPMDIEHGNDTIHEEIYHLLTNRGGLHEQFASLGTNGKMDPFWQQVQELDKILIKQRWMILDVVDVYDYYTRERERLDIPQSYWWWYLDELEAEELPEWVTDARAISSEHGSVVQRWSRVKHLRMRAPGVMHQQAWYCGSNWR